MLVFVIIHLQLLGIFLDTMYAAQIITAIRGGIATTSTFAARPAISPIPYCDKVSRFLSYFRSFLGQKPSFSSHCNLIFLTQPYGQVPDSHYTCDKGSNPGRHLHGGSLLLLQVLNAPQAPERLHVSDLPDQSVKETPRPSKSVM